MQKYKKYIFLFNMTSTTNLYQCRLCLKRTPTKVSVLAGDFPKMLEILTSIKVKENDGLPKYSCSKCAEDIKTALIIKKRIIKAHKILVENLKRKKPDLVERKIIEVLSKRNELTIFDQTPKITPNKLILLENNINSTNISEKDCKPEKSIEFIDVDSPYIPSNAVKNEVIEIIKTDCKEITLTLPKVEERTHNEEASLQNIIDKVMGDVKKVKKNLTCETCNITFNDRSTYYTHCGKHKKTKCQICSRLIRTDNFKKHFMLHTAGPSVCSICGATCKNIESLRGHIFYQHKSTANEYVCEECGKHFRIKYKFELHKKKEHIGIRSFKCETCGKSFFTNGNLMSHINMTHKKLRPHVCEFCGIGFSSSYALKTHKRQHTNEKPFKCEYCHEGFRQKVSLRSHLKSKHRVEEPREHVCEVCERGFATNYALNIHARLHMAEKCEVCSETFAEKEYLSNHLREAHNIIVESKGDDETFKIMEEKIC